MKHNKVNKSKKKDSSFTFVIIAILLAVSIAIAGSLYIFKPSEDKEDLSTYNYFKFEQQGKFWLTFVELKGIQYEAPFYNHPTEVENIPYGDGVTDFLLDVPHSKFWIAVNDNVGATPVLAGANIGRITGRLYGVATQSALYAELEERDVNQTVYPYVTCKDATELQPIIWINVKDSEQRIYLDEANPNCVVVGGTSDEEILESADLLAYKFLQIIE